MSPRKLAGGKLILDHPAEALARLTISNPDKRNALDHEVLDALAEALSVRWVLLSTLHPIDPGKACTIAYWDNGAAENFDYLLEDTPCANMVGQGACCFPNNIVSRFPKDQMLVEMGAESYLGTPLRSSTGEVVGLLAALDDRPLERVEQAAEIIELFSGRAAAELERLATASVNERLGRIVEDSVSEVYVFDAESYQFELVNRGARENLGYSMEELSALTPWDLKPHITQEEFVEFVTPLRNGQVPNLHFETVHERKDGSHYDVAVQLQFFPGVENLFYASINDITDRSPIARRLPLHWPLNHFPIRVPADRRLECAYNQALRPGPCLTGQRL